MPSIRTVDAQAALATLVRADATRVASGNTLVSRQEAKALTPFLARADGELRAAGGAGTRVTVDALVDHAMANAQAAWAAHNPSGNGTDSLYLSRAEVRAISEGDADLGRLTHDAYLRAGRAAPRPDATPRDAVLRFLEQARPGEKLRRPSPFGLTLDPRVGQADRASVPAPVLAAFDALHPAEDADVASVVLKRLTLSGEHVFAICRTGDGDTAYAEFFDAAARPLLSVRFDVGAVDLVDEHFGTGRFAEGMGLHGSAAREGFTDDIDNAAVGQITSTWHPDVVVTGLLDHDGARPTGLRASSTLTPAQQTLARAAFETLFAEHFVHQSHDPSKPIEIAPLRAGVLRLGTFTDPIANEPFVIADWQDIDDASWTFYFKRGDDGALRLARHQFNN